MARSLRPLASSPAARTGALVFFASFALLVGVFIATIPDAKAQVVRECLFDNSCPEQVGNESADEPPPTPVPEPTPDPAEEHAEAMDRVRANVDARVGAPTWQIWPGHTTNQHVRLDTWLYIPDGWESYDVSASSGSVTIDAAALPIASLWQFTDALGQVTIVCDNRGDAWTPGELIPPRCGKVWEHSSAVTGLVNLQVSVRYEIRYSSSYAGFGSFEFETPLGTPANLTVNEALTYGISGDEGVNGGDAIEGGGHSEPVLPPDDDRPELPAKVTACSISGSLGVEIPFIANASANAEVALILEEMPDGTVVVHMVEVIGVSGGGGGGFGVTVDTGDTTYGAVAGWEATLGGEIGAIQTWEMPAGTTASDFLQSLVVDAVVPDNLTPGFSIGGVGVPALPNPIAGTVEGALGGGLDDPTAEGVLIGVYGQVGADAAIELPFIESDLFEFLAEGALSGEAQIVLTEHADGTSSVTLNSGLVVEGGYENLEGMLSGAFGPLIADALADLGVPSDWEGSAGLSQSIEFVLDEDGDVIGLNVTQETQVNDQLTVTTLELDPNEVLDGLGDIDITDPSSFDVLDVLGPFEGVSQTYETTTEDYGLDVALGLGGSVEYACTTSTAVGGPEHFVGGGQLPFGGDFDDDCESAAGGGGGGSFGGGSASGDFGGGGGGSFDGNSGGGGGSFGGGSADGTFGGDFGSGDGGFGGGGGGSWDGGDCGGGFGGGGGDWGDDGVVFERPDGSKIIYNDDGTVDYVDPDGNLYTDIHTDADGQPVFEVDVRENSTGDIEFVQGEPVPNGSVPDEWTQADADAIAEYTTDAGSPPPYQEINTALRTGNIDAEMQDRIDAIEAALDQLPSHNGPAWRGVESLPPAVVANLVPGETFSDAAFFSTSSDSSEAFPGDFQFHITDSHSGHNIGPMSQIPSEDEVLFSPGTEFIITNVEVIDGVTYVTMHEAP